MSYFVGGSGAADPFIREYRFDGFEQSPEGTFSNLDREEMGGLYSQNDGMAASGGGAGNLGQQTEEELTMIVDTSLSWDNPFINNWTEHTPSSLYTNERSKSSGATGYLLDFKDPKINAKFYNALYHAYDRGLIGRAVVGGLTGTPRRVYDPFIDNCAQAFNVAINAISKDIKVPKSHAVRPVAIEQYIKQNLMPRGFVTGMQKFK